MIFWMSIAFSYSEEDRDSEYSIADFKYPGSKVVTHAPI